MQPLDDRKIRILDAVVQDYVDTSKPVGSERLIEVYRLGCKSATVRNEMAEMAEMGYLAQPHTSAGRIPTDRGYRYFVNELMAPPGVLPADEARRARTSLSCSGNEIDEILQQTCRVLSGLTSYASLATDPVTDTVQFRRIYLTHASARQVLMIVLFSTGHVEHRLLEVDSAPADRELHTLSNLISSVIADQCIEDADRLMRGLSVQPELADLAAVAAVAIPNLVALSRSLTERKVYFDGASHLLRQPEFHDVQRLEELLNALEQRNALFRVLMRGAAETPEVTVYIGSENPYEKMKSCTLIVRSYRIGDRQAGYVGVVGPTRMHYQRAIAAVNFMSNSLSTMLTSMRVA